MKNLNFELPSNFNELFNSDIIEAIIDSLKQAYNDADESFVDGFGDDKFTFGNKIWRYSVYQLKQHFQNKIDSVHIRERSNRFRMQIGNFNVGVNKIGYTGKEDINESFPNNTKNIEAMAIDQFSQLSFFDFQLSENQEVIEYENIALNNLIIGHMGNIDDGLCAIYFCFPILDKEEKIVKWAHTIKVWDINSDHQYEKQHEVNTSHIIPPEEIVESPVLTLKSETEGITINGQ